MRTSTCRTFRLCCCVLDALYTLRFSTSFKSKPMRWEQYFPIRTLLTAEKRTPYQNGLNNRKLISEPPERRVNAELVMHRWTTFLATRILSFLPFWPPQQTGFLLGPSLLLCWEGYYNFRIQAGSMPRDTVKWLASSHVPFFKVTGKAISSRIPSQLTCLSLSE